MRTITLTAILMMAATTAFAAPSSKKDPNVTDLGVMAGSGEVGPGDVLKGQIEKIAPGGSLEFTAPTNQIWGLGTLTVKPAGAATITQTLVKKKIPGMLGGATYYQYKITLPKNAKAGTPITVTSSGNYMTRNSPHWAFSFTIDPTPKTAAAEYVPIPLIPASMGGSPVPGADGAPAYVPIPLIPDFMGGSPVPGANVSRNDDSRGPAAQNAQPIGSSSAHVGTAR